MGIYDRDYHRDSYGHEPGLHLGGPQSMVIKLVIVTAVVYVVQLLFQQPDGSNPINALFSLQEDWYRRPWKVFQLLTYGFLHDTRSMWHILGNMFVLWMFGRSVEPRYGGKEFLAFYLTAIVVAAVLWNVCELFSPGSPRMLGASGGVSAVLLLFIFLYPHATVLFMFLIPMRAWVLGVFIVAADALGAVQQYGNTAFTAHLGGFLFAYLYYKFGWRLMDWVPGRPSMPRFRRKPPLRVHRPEPDQVDRHSKRLDELLGKVHEHGQESLTASEQRELRKLSKHYQNKRR